MYIMIAISSNRQPPAVAPGRAAALAAAVSDAPPGIHRARRRRRGPTPGDVGGGL